MRRHWVRVCFHPRAKRPPRWLKASHAILDIFHEQAIVVRSMYSRRPATPTAIGEDHLQVLAAHGFAGCPGTARSCAACKDEQDLCAEGGADVRWQEQHCVD